MKKLLLTFLIILFFLTSKVYGAGELNKGTDAYERGDFITAYMWLSIIPGDTLWSIMIMKELEQKLSPTEKKRAKDDAAKKKGYSSWNEMKAEERRREAERKRIAAAKKAEEKKKADTPNSRIQKLQESYVDYLIIRSIY